MQMESAFTFTFTFTLWLLDNTSGFCLQLFNCNILQILIFDNL